MFWKNRTRVEKNSSSGDARDIYNDITVLDFLSGVLLIRK